MSLDAGLGNATVKIGSGADTITVGGYFNAVAGGNGNDIVDDGIAGGCGSASGNDTVNLGNGNDTVDIGGYSNSITVGNGADIITEARAPTRSLPAPATIRSFSPAGATSSPLAAAWTRSPAAKAATSSRNSAVRPLSTCPAAANR